MTKTNFEKLTRWDADYYNSLTDDDCIVCLTEREIYLIGQIIEPLTWRATRWLGDVTGLDFKAISAQLEHKLSERMTCQNITKLLEKIQSLESKIDYVFEQTVIDNGETLPDETTPAWDVTTPEEFEQEYTYTSDGCDTADKDALYGAVYNLVRYVNQVNIDALQQLSQVGNLAQQIDKLISAATGGLTPLDEVASYVDFLVNELLEEYEATVDEELLKTVTCDLFCIAVNGNCNLNLSDVINYYGSKIGTTALDFASSILDVMQFAATGTFSGDQYFYFMTTFQFITVALTDHFFGVDSMDNYMVQMAVGANSPDNDWTLLCDECPPMYRVKTFNFAYGAQDWEVGSFGEFTGSRFKGTDIPTFGTYSKLVIMENNTWDDGWIAYGARVIGERNKDTTGLGLNGTEFRMRTTPDSDAGSTYFGYGDYSPSGVFDLCNTGLGTTGINQVFAQFRITIPEDDLDIYVDQIQVLFDMNNAPIGSVVYVGNIGDWC